MLMMVLARPLVRLMMITDQVTRIAMLMGMHMKHANQEKHRDQAAQRPAREPIDRPLHRHRVRH
jgi:hypothetical protein